MEAKELVREISKENNYRDQFLEAMDRIEELKRENEKLHKALLITVLKLD